MSVIPSHLAFEGFLTHLNKNPAFWNSMSAKQKENWAIVGAAWLVIKIENPKNSKKQSFFGFWKRVKHAETAAIIIAGLLQDQALALKSMNLYMFWTKVKLFLENGEYHG